MEHWSLSLYTIYETLITTMIVIVTKVKYFISFLLKTTVFSLSLFSVDLRNIILVRKRSFMFTVISKCFFVSDFIYSLNSNKCWLLSSETIGTFSSIMGKGRFQLIFKNKFFYIKGGEGVTKIHKNPLRLLCVLNRPKHSPLRSEN